MKNIKKKSRIGLSAAAGLLAATGSIPPLTMSTSCSETKTKNSAIDKEYGVTKEIYEDLKNQFRLAYSQKLQKVYKVESDDYRIRMEALEKDLSNFDKIQDNSNLSYLALTNTLVDFAREQKQEYPTGNAAETEPYGIQLIRHTRTKWSDVNDLYAGMADSFKTYMHNSKMPTSTINRILTESKAKFDDLVKQLKATYGNDALSGLLKAKEQVITFFDEVNDDVALISSCLRLKDFMSEFVFECIDYDENGIIYTDNCLNKLEQDYPDEFVEGKVLSNELMNKIFTITRKTTGKTVDFDAKTLVPGYTIQPKLIQISKNPRSNVYAIAIDFGIVKNVYEQKYANDPERLATVTGHLYDFNQEDFTNGKINDNSTIADILRLSNIRTFDYNLRLTPDAEKQALIDSYFNPECEYGNISFKWDMNNQAYEAFFDNARQNADGTWTGRLETQSLANAGLMISNNNDQFFSLTNVSERSGKIENVKNQNLSDVFMQNCALMSDVNIDENNSKGKLVTNAFKVAYANSRYGKNAICDIKEEYYQAQCVNFAVSNKFFKKVNDKFNQIASYIGNYNSSLKKINRITNELSDNDEAKLELLNAEANASMLLQSCYLASVGIAIISLIFFVWAPWKDGRSKKINIICTLLCLTTGILESANFTIFKLFYYDKAKEHIKNVREANKELDQSNLLSMLKQDLKDNFVLINEDGTYDKVLFANQKAKFEKNSMSDMLNMYRKYATINQYDYKDATVNTEAQNALKEFDQILEEHDADSETFIDTFADWKVGTGKWWWVSFAISFACMLVSSITLVAVRESLVDPSERIFKRKSKSVQVVDEAVNAHVEEKQEDVVVEQTFAEVIESHFKTRPTFAEIYLEFLEQNQWEGFKTFISIKYAQYVDECTRNGGKAEDIPQLSDSLEGLFGKGGSADQTPWDSKKIIKFLSEIVNGGKKK